MLKIIGFITVLCILAIPFSASAKSCNCINYGTITAYGTGTLKIKPNGSRLYVSINVFSKSHKMAYIDLLNQAHKVINHLESFNIAAYHKSKITYLIRTAQINISPNRIYKKGKWIIDGYNAIENLIIKIRGNKNTNNAILYLLKYKSTSINRIVPIVSNIEKYKIEAVKLAYKHAISKIKAVLKLTGVKSYTVKTVDIKSAVQRIFPVPVIMQAKTVNVGSKVYFPGKNKITANVFIKAKYKNAN
ncbi:MAG: SIMPL domain-containing protein [Deltaproteobacteria bacterium]|jgi:uncharacterized protein YggE|nr:SIMPL domain-containing protein [Deltaproteobacteria bacterium]